MIRRTKEHLSKIIYQWLREEKKNFPKVADRLAPLIKVLSAFNKLASFPSEAISIDSPAMIVEM